MGLPAGMTTGRRAPKSNCTRWRMVQREVRGVPAAISYAEIQRRRLIEQKGGKPMRQLILNFMNSRCPPLLRRIGQEERGVNMVIFAIGLMVMMGMGGVAVDGGNAYYQQQRMQIAADAAALGGARALANGQGTVAVDSPDPATGAGQRRRQRDLELYQRGARRACRGAARLRHVLCQAVRLRHVLGQRRLGGAVRAGDGDRQPVPHDLLVQLHRRRREHL